MPFGLAGIPHLTELLSHKEQKVRSFSAYSLAHLGKTAAPAAAAIAKLAKDDDQARRPALNALGRIGPAAKPHVEVVKAYLGSPDAHVRFAAAWALVQISPSDPAESQTLSELIQKPDSLKVNENELPFVEETGGTNIDAVRLRSSFYEQVAERLFEIDPEAAVKAGGFERVVRSFRGGK